MGSSDSPSFLVCWLALPFWPALWRESGSRGSGWVLLPLILWALVSGAVIGIRAANAVRASVYAFATHYEESADPLLLDGGRFSLTGDRILRVEDTDGKIVFLIDPEETVPDEQVTGAQTVVVRADKVVVRQPGQTREWPATEVAKLFGEHVLFDAGWVRHATDSWLLPAMVVGFPVFAAVGNLAVCAVYAFAVGLLLLLLRGQWLGLGYPACVTVALATSAFTIVADLGLKVLGVELPVKSFVLWPLVMAVLGFVALSGRGSEDARS